MASANSDLRFIPKLLRVEVSADQINIGEVVWITTWWQNIGSAPSERPQKCFVQMEFGHQRIEETRDNIYRKFWDPYPATNQWKHGEVWKTTCRWKFIPNWSGTFKIYIGMCDENSVPVEITLDQGIKAPLVHAGEIDISWGWGIPTVEKVRKPWTKQFCLPAQFDAGPEIREKEEFINIKGGISAKFLKQVPVLLGMGDEKSCFEFEGCLPELVLRNRESNKLLYSSEMKVDLDYRMIGYSENSVEYSCSVSILGELYAGFNMKYVVDGRKLRHTISNEWDKAHYELLEIKVPAFISASGNDVNLMVFYKGGRLIPLDTSLPISYCHKYHIRNASALYNGHSLLVFESTCLDDKMWVNIRENLKNKIAGIGYTIVNRVRANSSSLESIKVENVHSVEIDMPDEGWGMPCWQTAAKFLRKDLKSRNGSLYKRSLFCKYYATEGQEPPKGRVKEDSPYSLKRLTKFRTFNQILDDIRQYNNIFDGMPLIAYIGGFQKGGFDNGYPYMLDTDDRVGTIEELKNCILEGKKYNAIVSIHDNFDSCIPGEHFDPQMVCMDEEGQPWKGWIWAAGLEYITSPCKYAKLGTMQRRVRDTLGLYGIEKSIHLDVLSAEPLRYDFDPACPASAQKSLEGKYAIIEEFNKYDVDVTSENLVHPFADRIGHVLWTGEDRSDTLFSGERYIPLIYMVYHGIIGYCGPSGSKTELLWSMVRANQHYVEEYHTSDSNIRWIYLQNMPLRLLEDKIIREVIEKGASITVIYDDNTYAWVDFDKMEYELVIDGQLVAKDFSCFIPGFKEKTYLAYKLESGILSYPVPKGWSETAKLKAVALTLEGEGGIVPVEVKDGFVELEMKAGVPVRIMFT